MEVIVIAMHFHAISKLLISEHGVLPGIFFYYILDFELRFINDTPNVTGRMVSAIFAFSPPGIPIESAICGCTTQETVDCTCKHTQHIILLSDC